MAICAPFDPAGPYVSSVLSYIDCQSVALAQQGYRALGAGSSFAAALDGLLVIVVAIAGYRMVLGGPFVIRDAVQLVIKIGFVLALALHWAAYQPLVYDVATRGPQDLLGRLFAGSGTGADDSPGMVRRVQAVDTVIGGVLHPDREFAGGGSPAIVAGAAPAPPPISAQTPFGQSAELAPETRETLGSADNILVMSVVAAFAALRIVIAIMLALGPIFIAAALFDTARGLFAGWLRVLLGTILASVALAAVVALELAVIEPQVTALRRLFESGQALGSLPERLWVSSSLFALVMLAAVLASMRVASAFRFPDAQRGEYIWTNQTRQILPTLGGTGSAVNLLPAPERAHAQRTADAAMAAERRDHREGRQTQVFRIAGPRDNASASRNELVPQASAGYANREAGRRRSAAAGRRDME